MTNDERTALAFVIRHSSFVIFWHQITGGDALPISDWRIESDRRASASVTAASLPATLRASPGRTPSSSPRIPLHAVRTRPRTADSPSDVPADPPHHLR